MRKSILLFLLIVACLSSFSQSNHVVISQVYGGGGNSGALYKNDFIELFNPTNSPISLEGWSVQYASSAGTSWGKTSLTGTIPANGYYLIQQAKGTGGSEELPTPDAIGGITMAAGAGKVALLNNNITLSGACPTGVVDLVGFGSTTCFEGSGSTPPPSNTTAAIRKLNGCTDTDNNIADFETGSPNPRNSSSPINVCTATNCTPPSNQPTVLNFTSSFETISGTFTGAAAGNIAADAYLVLVSQASELTQQPISGTTYTVGASLGNAIVVSASNATSFLATGLSPSSTYNFFVFAFTQQGVCYNLVSPLAGSASTSGAPFISVTAGNDASESLLNGTFKIAFSTTTTSSTEIKYSLSGTALFTTDYTAKYSPSSQSLNATTGTINIPAGTDTIIVTISPVDDALLEGTENVQLNLSNATGGYTIIKESETINISDNEIPNIVINQVYGGGGNSGATYKNDFIELYNNENFAISLSGWSVQYASATGTSWQKTLLNHTIPAKGFYLIQEAKGSGGTMDLPTPDDAGTIAMSANNGKIILSNSTESQTGANPSGATVIDKVGFGSANGYETAPAPAPSATTSIKRVVEGIDNNDNLNDFALVFPEPRNSTYTTSAPAIVTLNPTNNSAGIPYNIQTSIIFNKPVHKGTGNITIYENGLALTSIDVASASVTIDRATVIIDINYTPGKSYYINIDATAFKDAYENFFSGITDDTSWSFSVYNSTVAVNVPVSFDFQNCTGTGMLPNGFTQFSESGSALWDCTPFGRDASSTTGTALYGVQMNGFTNGTNVQNVDWLISPSIDLTGTTYPLLSFWSRTAFNGRPLQLKISTDYPGTGDPRNFTWSDLNGKFPSLASNVWTISENINLSLFKESNVHFAFIYSSSDDDGARWSLDDVSLINSSTPPPPSLTVGTNDIQFSYVPGASTAEKTFQFIGNDLINPIELNSTGAFLLSKDGIEFTSSIFYTAEEATDQFKTVFVRFAPPASNQNYEGSILVSTSDLQHKITLKGSSIDPATTLEVVNWNVEWFGSTTLGPTNEVQQEENVKKILQDVNADIYGLVEVVDESKLAKVVSEMPGYGYVISNYGSHTNTSLYPASALNDAQKMAFIYKTSLFNNITTTALLSAGINTKEDLSNPAYNYWASGRFPYMMSADVTLNGITKNIKFVLVHAKANTAPTAGSYDRRKKGADTLAYTMKKDFDADNIIMLGDFNDDLDQTITDGINPPVTSYSTFTSDASNFFSPTLALSLEKKKSTVSYNDMIDHVMTSNEAQTFYMPSTATVLSDVSSLVTNYGSTTSDHYPVFTRYMFCSLTCPSNIVVANDEGKCGAIIQFNPSATMTCGTVTAVPASGSFFPVGTTTVNITSSTGESCSFTVTVNDGETPTITAPAAITADADAGKCSASNINLVQPIAIDNCGIASVTNNAPTDGLFDVGENIITWTVEDVNGNKSTTTQTIIVVDKEDPVIMVCPSLPVQCFNRSNNYTIPSIIATDNCNSVTTSFVITGATNRTGSGTDASGHFNIGSSYINWTVTDSHGNTTRCITTVVINSPVTSSIPDVFAITPGGAANTIYLGYGPSSLQLNAVVNGGTAPYNYKWTIGSSAGQGLSSSSSFTISPVTTTTYYLNVKDVYGCTVTAATKTINVVDVRCGPKSDKVTICVLHKGKYTSNCVSQNQVQSYLGSGSYLGKCQNATTLNSKIEKVQEQLSKFSVSVFPNPTSNQFAVTINRSNERPFSMRVINAVGAVVENRKDLTANTIAIGRMYAPGVYYLEVMQGEEKILLKLIKSAD